MLFHEQFALNLYLQVSLQLMYQIVSQPTTYAISRYAFHAGVISRLKKLRHARIIYYIFIAVNSFSL